MKLTEVPGKRLWESHESQMKAGRYNPAWTYHFFFRGINRRIVLPVGSSDDWYILTDGLNVYCVSWNRPLDYCGVTLFLAEGKREMQEGGSVFCQSEEQYRDVLGKRGLDLTDRTICRRLIETLNECCY